MTAEHNFKQLTLTGDELMSDYKEALQIGMEAVEVVDKIFKFHAVKHFSYTKYDPNSTYPMDQDQTLFWSNWSGTADIEALSKRVLDETMQKFKIENSNVDILEILAICSKVQTEKDIKHLPMLDFDFSDYEIGMDMIKNSGLPHGVILQTDHSYHYYGLNLIDTHSWEKWINHLLSIKDSEDLFGHEYLTLCLDRGYSALRIFGYKGTSKETTPVVVAKI